MANIKDEINNILKAIFGKDVRQSLADGLTKINEECESTTNKEAKFEEEVKEILDDEFIKFSEEVEVVDNKQNILEEKFNQLIINAGDSNAEVVNSRTDFEGKTYETLGARLDYIQKYTSISPTEEQVTIKHNLGKYPSVKVFETYNGAGVVPAGQVPKQGLDIFSLDVRIGHMDEYKFRIFVPINKFINSAVLSKVNDHEFVVAGKERSFLIFLKE